MEQDTGATGAAQAHVLCRWLQGTAGRTLRDISCWGALVLHQSVYNLIPLPGHLRLWPGKAHGSAPVLFLYYFKLFKELSYGIGSTFYCR